MARHPLQSDYGAGKPAWIDWAVVGTLLLVALAAFVGNEPTVSVLAAAGGLSFGLFLTVAEFGALHAPESSD